MGEPAIAERGTLDGTGRSTGAIEVTDVSMRYCLRSGREIVPALERVSLHLRPGSFVTVIGPSGCGKTTLLKVVAGLLPPTGGTVRVDGADVTGGARSLGVMFQKPLLLPWRTALENALLPVDAVRRRRAGDVERARRMLELVGLAQFADAYPHELSAGMQQRVAIARTLLPDPAVMLMDEPFGALDELTREGLNLELMRIWETSRKTILLVTHSVPEAVFLSEEIVVMAAGGRLEQRLQIDLPRPRTPAVLRTGHYADAVVRVRNALGLDR